MFILCHGFGAQFLINKEMRKISAFNGSGSYTRYAGIVSMVFIYIAAYFLSKQLTKWKRIKKEKEEEYDEKVIKRAISEVIPGAEFIRDQCIKPKLLREYGIIPLYDAYEEKGMVHYRRNENDYFFSNIHLFRKKEDKNGNKTYSTIYKGQIYTANYKTGLPGNVRIFATKMLLLTEKEVNWNYSSKRAGEIKIETENINFNDNFDVYATNEQSAFFILNSLVMEQLLAMKQLYGEIGIYISGENVVIALKTNKILFSRKLYNDQQEKESLEKSKEEAGKMLKMAELLEDTINGSIKNNFTHMAN